MCASMLPRSGAKRPDCNAFLFLIDEQRDFAAIFPGFVVALLNSTASGAGHEHNTAARQPQRNSRLLAAPVSSRICMPPPARSTM